MKCPCELARSLPQGELEQARAWIRGTTLVADLDTMDRIVDEVVPEPKPTVEPGPADRDPHCRTCRYRIPDGQPVIGVKIVESMSITDVGTLAVS